MFEITTIKLKPTEAEKKLEKKNILLKNNLLFSRFQSEKMTLKEKVIGEWTIEKEERCNICWVNIKKDEEFTRCTSCNNKFHTEHWKEWIRTKQSCPICKVKIAHY